MIEAVWNAPFTPVPVNPREILTILSTLPSKPGCTGRVDCFDMLDPHLLARLGSLDVIARTIVDGTMVGMHASRSRGIGTEFSQYRQYIAGDDLRALDWRVYGRTDRYYVRLFSAETNLEATLIVDASASMRFTSIDVSKFHVARMLAAALAYLLVGQSDRVSLVPVAGSGRTERISAGSGDRHLRAILLGLERLVADGDASLVSALDGLIERLRRRGPVFVFSDAYEPAKDLVDAIGRLARAGFDVTLMHILDPVERSLEIGGDTEFVGLEGDGRLTADPRRVGRAYRERLDAHIAELSTGCARCGALFIPVTTSEPLDRPLAAALRARRLLGGRL